MAYNQIDDPCRKVTTAAEVQKIPTDICVLE